MVKLNNYFPEIIIRLTNGVYLFDNMSFGKTRLYKELRKNQTYGENIAAYSYEDYLSGIPIENFLVPNKNSVIMLDRYDMYNGAGKELISKCKDNCVILIDCKHNLNFSIDYQFCTLEMTGKLIEVWSDFIFEDKKMNLFGY